MRHLARGEPRPRPARGRRSLSDYRSRIPRSSLPEIRTRCSGAILPAGWTATCPRCFCAGPQGHAGTRRLAEVLNVLAETFPGFLGGFGDLWSFQQDTAQVSPVAGEKKKTSSPEAPAARTLHFRQSASQTPWPADRQRNVASPRFAGPSERPFFHLQRTCRPGPFAFQR